MNCDGAFTSADLPGFLIALRFNDPSYCGADAISDAMLNDGDVHAIVAAIFAPH